MPSKGLMIAGGIGKGLQAGLDTFLKTRGLLNEEAERAAGREDAAKRAALQRAAFILRAQKEGYAYDDANGLQETETGKRLRAAELERARAQAELMRARARKNNLGLDAQYGGGELEQPTPEPPKVAKPELPVVGPMSPVGRGPQSVAGPMSPMRTPQSELDEVTQGLIDRASHGKDMSDALLGKKHGGMSQLQSQAENDGGLIKGVMKRYPKETGPIYDRKALLQYQKMLNSKTKQLGDVITNANTIEEFANDARVTPNKRANPMKAAALPVMLARAVGEKGPLSNFDVQMWGGSKALISRLNRAAEQMISGTLPDEDLDFVIEVAQGLGKAAQGRLAEAENEVVGQFQSNYGGDSDWAYEKVVGKKRKKPGDRKPVRRMVSPSRPGKVKVIYDDNTEEIIDAPK